MKNITKDKKIEYINDTYNRFINARNHGGNGNNWWNPTPNTIAYNIKMRIFADVEELRKYLTERQNEYHSNNFLQSYIDDELDMQARFAVESIEDMSLVLSIHFAGRSGGWLEVEYDNQLEEVDENTDSATLDDFYKQAKELANAESKVHEYIKEEHELLNKYIGTTEYYKDIFEHLQSDDEIAEIYKGRIHELTEKLK